MASPKLTYRIMKNQLMRRPRIWLLAMMAVIPTAGHAQFTITTNSGVITVTGYTGSSSVVIIPSIMNGYPVAGIGPNAFSGKGNVTGITLPDGITNIGDNAFLNDTALTNINIPGSVVFLGTNVCADCYQLATVTLGDGLTSISAYMFNNDGNLPALVIPNSVTSIGPYAFRECQNMTNIVLSASLTSIGAGAFDNDYALAKVYFLGNAPSAQTNLFHNATHATAYYLPYTTGWTNTFGGAPAVLWTPPLPSLGITTYSNQPVVILPYLAESIGMHFQVQMTTNLNSGNWVEVTNGVQFIAVQITNPPSPAYFRLR